MLKKRQILVPSDAIWLPAALLSDKILQVESTRRFFGERKRGLLNLRWCWDHSTVDWTLDVTQPDSTTNKKLQKVGGPPLLIDLIDQKLAVSRMRSSSLAKGGKVGIPSLELDSGPKRWTSANWLCFIVPIVRWFYHLVMTLPVCHGKSPCYSVR